MASARTIFALVGLVVAILGIGVALMFDRYFGMAILIVGAFLLILPFARSQDDE